MTQIVGVEQDQIAGVGRVELIQFETAVEDGQIPFELVDEDLLSRGKHAA